jgi:hypothetical protein
MIFMNDENSFSKIIKQYNCSMKANHTCENGCLLSGYENNCYEICSYYFYYNDTINQYQCTKKNQCPDIYNKLNLDKKECVKSCSETKENKHEYNNICFKECPKNFITSENYCIPNCTEENPFLSLKTLECVSKCKLDEYLKICIRIYFTNVNEAVKNLFSLNNTNKNYKNNSVKISDMIIDSLLSGELNDILDQLIFSNSSIIIKEDDEVHQITALSNQKDKNVSSISFGLCEDINNFNYI